MNKEELKELAATLNGIADGKAWECMWGEGFDNPCGRDVDYCLKMHIPIRLKPWSLPPPPDGMQWHRDDWTEEMLPEGYRPLLKDEPKLPGDEIVPSPFAGKHTWVAYTAECPYVADDSVYWFIRTKRPLSQPQQPDPYAELKAAHAAGKVIQFRFVTENNHSTWRDDKAEQPAFGLAGYEFRIKPEQQKVPLQPSDVPPGSAFTAIPNAIGYCCPVVVDEDGCYFASRDDGQDKTVSWEAMVDGWQINRSIPLTGKWNPEAWEPCYKLIDTP